MTAYHIDRLPTSIWVENFGDIPACYQGTPEEMLVSMAHDYGSNVAPEDAIEFIIQDFQAKRDLKLRLPSEAPHRVKAALIIAAMLVTGHAKETPRA